MGIDGLLNLLRPVTEKQHISSFKDKTVAVDAMPWIYKGCYSCAMELNQNIESIDFLYYILEMLDMLSYYNIKPIFVFDGRSVMAKSDTLEKRKKSKQENKQKGLQFLKNNQLQEARKYLSRCIIIDQRIITMTINCLVTKNVQFIVAPYEADCQIAKLKRLGMVDAVISEDSDLIAFGVNVILKLNQNGECDYVDLNKWKPKDVTDVFLKYFLAFDELSRIDAAILAGSDYNQSVKGIGIKRAIKLLTTQVTMKNVINKLKYKKTYMSRIPQNYQQTVQKSKLIFNLSTVYNPVTKQLQFLRPQLVDQLKPEDMNEEQLLQIVGRRYEQYNQEVVNGRVSSKTLEKRQIKPLNFPQIFRVNKQNMMAHEIATKKRKYDQEQLRIKQAQQAANYAQNSNGDDMIYQQLKQFKSRAGHQQTPEQIQKRKQERKNRINRLQQLMSTFCDALEDDSQEDKKIFGDSDDQNDQLKKTSETIQIPSRSEEKQKVNLSQQKTSIKKVDKEENQSNKDAVSQQQSVSEDLGFLNPFLKKDNKPNAMKPEQIFGSSKKK